MLENIFDVKYDYTNGGVSSIVNKKDGSLMNWVEGDHVWGVIKDSEFISCSKTDNGIKAVYRTKNLLVTVFRILENNRYRERYIFKDNLNTDVFFNRGAVGIYATFNDNYEKAEVSMTKRCNTHIWCGGNTSYINAVKMGPCDFGLGLVLTEGSLDTYSIDRVIEHSSDDRGDFILHPSVFNLRPGEEMCIEWEMIWYTTGEFYQEIEKYNSVTLIDTENYTVFLNEKIRFTINKDNAQVSLNGKIIQTKIEDGRTTVEYTPEHTGEYSFIIKVNKTETYAKFFVQIPFRELVKRRINFIVDKQQFHCKESALDGAYLIYDTQDKCQIFDDLNGDYNASRERLVMGLLVAKYLQHNRDQKVYDSLMKYYQFVSREFFDEETGIVFNTIGKDLKFKRLYNGPWMSMFMMELYKLTENESFLDKMFKILVNYYNAGGYNFYPNGLSMYESIEVLRRSGKTYMADELTKLFEKHVDNIVNNRLNYPTHEVRYEQTIVTPAVNLIAQMYQINQDPKLIKECRRHLDVLERFNGRQPSYFLNDLAVRHWDGFWFGKRRMFGDTLPHSASIHTSVAFLHYYYISHDEVFLKRAFCGARNTLSLFKEDGSASCAYLYPLFVNGNRCEYYDEFANEQDGVLYYMIKFFGMMD